jgi:hypothetical protein
MSKKHLPAAVPVSIGCSVALSEAPRAHLADDVLKIRNAASEAIDAGAHQDVTWPKEFEHGAQLLTALRRRPAPLLRMDHIAAGRSQGDFLNREVLIGRADPRVADDGHDPQLFVLFASRP